MRMTTLRIPVNVRNSLKRRAKLENRTMLGCLREWLDCPEVPRGGDKMADAEPKHIVDALEGLLSQVPEEYVECAQCACPNPILEGMDICKLCHDDNVYERGNESTHEPTHMMKNIYPDKA